MGVAVSTVIGILVRHLIGAIGLSELIPDVDIDKITAAIITVVAIAWSAYQKRNLITR